MSGPGTVVLVVVGEPDTGHTAPSKGDVRGWARLPQPQHGVLGRLGGFRTRDSPLRGAAHDRNRGGPTPAGGDPDGYPIESIRAKGTSWPGHAAALVDGVARPPFHRIVKLFEIRWDAGEREVVPDAVLADEGISVKDLSSGYVTSLTGKVRRGVDGTRAPAGPGSHATSCRDALHDLKRLFQHGERPVAAAGLWGLINVKLPPLLPPWSGVAVVVLCGWYVGTVAGECYLVVECQCR